MNGLERGFLLTFDKKPNTPVKKCEKRDSVPLATPIPTLRGLVGLLKNSLKGIETKSFAPFINELNTIVGLPTKSSDPMILWI